MDEILIPFLVSALFVSVATNVALASAAWGLYQSVCKRLPPPKASAQTSVFPLFRQPRTEKRKPVVNDDVSEWRREQNERAKARQGEIGGSSLLE